MLILLRRIFKKSLDLGGEKLAYFKRGILAHLDSLEPVKKSFLFMLKGGKGLPVGTIKEWKGKKYIKTPSGKWKPKYDKDSRGAKMSIAAIKKKVSAAKDEYEMMQIVLDHRDRFSDAHGNPIPLTMELHEHIKTEQERRGKPEKKSDTYGALLVEKGIARVENQNVKADFTNKQWQEILDDTEKKPGPVWGRATKGNDNAIAFAYINSKRYQPIDLSTRTVDTNFSGAAQFEKVKDWAARRRFAQDYIKQPEFATRKELPELVRFDSLNNNIYDTIEVGKPFKLTGITATSADKRFITGVARSVASRYKKYPNLKEKVVMWHYRRDDVFERNVGNVRIDDGSIGTRKRPYELTVGGNSAIVDKIEEKNGITHVYVHLEDD